VEANAQREEVLPSEKAFAYSMKLEAIKHQGKMTRTSSQVGRKLEAAEVVGEEVGESRNQVHRFIRLTELIPALLDLVDAKKMPLATAVEVSYINKQTQEYLAEYIRENGMVKSYQIAALRRYLTECKSIGRQKLSEVLAEGFNGRAMPKSITIPEQKLKKYFSSNYSARDMEKIIYRLLDEWKAKSDAIMKKHSQEVVQEEAAQEEGGSEDEEV